MPRACRAASRRLPLAELGTSVRSPDRRRLGLAQRLGQTPVDDQRLAVLADDDVARLDVAVRTPRLWAYSMALHTSMNRRRSLRSSSDRRPGRPSGLIGVEAVDGLLELVAADEPHGVIGPAVAVSSQAVDRDDPGMLQPAGDLGLEQETLAAHRVVGVTVQDLLERHLTVQLVIERHEDGARPPLACGRRTRNRSPSDVAVPTE